MEWAALPWLGAMAVIVRGLCDAHRLSGPAAATSDGLVSLRPVEGLTRGVSLYGARHTRHSSHFAHADPGRSLVGCHHADEDGVVGSAPTTSATLRSPADVAAFCAQHALPPAAFAPATPLPARAVVVEARPVMWHCPRYAIVGSSQDVVAAIAASRRARLPLLACAAAAAGAAVVGVAQRRRRSPCA
jgi:hypothetical protein